MLELDKVHDGVILDGVGYQKDSEEIRRIRKRKVPRGSTERAQVIQFDRGDYYVASKEMQKGNTDISARDVRYRQEKKQGGFFERLSRKLTELSNQKGGLLR